MMARASWLAVAAVASLVASACGSEEDDRPARWSYISQAIIRPSCATASCHSTTTATGGLQLEEPHGSHVILVGYGGGNYVVPGSPTESKLVHMLRGNEVWRMPPDQPLPEADIQLIERWILEGAENN